MPSTWMRETGYVDMNQGAKRMNFFNILMMKLLLLKIQGCLCEARWRAVDYQWKPLLLLGPRLQRGRGGRCARDVRKRIQQHWVVYHVAELGHNVDCDSRWPSSRPGSLLQDCHQRWQLAHLLECCTFQLGFWADL